jgi:teichuronic acid biosynthesis glycosyltransferase TuaC
MHILTFTSLFPNSSDETLGVFIYQRMAHVNRRQGNKVTVVAPVPYFPSWIKSSTWGATARIPRVEQIGELTVYHPRYLLLPKISMPLHGLLMFLGSYLLVRRLHRQISFECIDGHYIYPDCFAAVLIGKLLGLPVAASARGTDMNLFPSFRLLRPMIRWTLKNTAGNIGVCKALTDEMVKLGVPPERVAVIGNGVDLGRFNPVDQKQARQELGLPVEDLIVVAVGALIPRKGFQFLIPAMARLAPRFPKLVVYIVGKGDTAELQALARTCNVSDRMIFAGGRPNEELRLWYSAANLSCLVSSREGWPNVVLESLACGTPVVATGLWGVPEILVSPELGIMVAQEPAAIADGIGAALEHKWNRDAIVRYARTRTWETVAAEVENYLVRISAEHRSEHRNDIANAQGRNQSEEISAKLSKIDQ